MKRLGILLALSLGLAALPSPADARLLNSWPYDKLMKKADLVVFAIPLKTEKSADVPPDHDWPCELVGQNTAFKVSHALKGKAERDEIKVLHFKFGERKKSMPDAVIIENGPLLVAFRTEAVTVTVGGEKTVLGPPEYLLYLKKLKDGRYEPVSGRIDPALSVREVSAPLDKVLGGK